MPAAAMAVVTIKGQYTTSCEREPERSKRQRTKYRTNTHHGLLQEPVPCAFNVPAVHWRTRRSVRMVAAT